MAGGTQCPYCAQLNYLYVFAFSVSTNRFVKTISLGVYDDSNGDMGQYVNHLTYNSRTATIHASVCKSDNFPSWTQTNYVISSTNHIVSKTVTGPFSNGCP